MPLPVMTSPHKNREMASICRCSDCSPLVMTRARLPLVRADQLRFRQHVAFNCIQQLLLRGFGFESGQLVKRVQFEMIIMRGSAWWTRSAVADLSKVIFALLRSILQGFVVSDAGREVSYVRWNVVKHPMNPRATRSIRIISNQ